MAQNALERLYTAESNLEFLTKNGADGDMTAEEKAFTETFDSYRQKFDRRHGRRPEHRRRHQRHLRAGAGHQHPRWRRTPPRRWPPSAWICSHEFTDVLGLLYNKKEEDDSLDSKVEAMIEARQAARKAKNFAEADRIRDELKAMGITLMDTPQGVKWSKD